MVPRQEILGIDLDEPWEENLSIMQDSPYTRLPVFRGDIDNVEGLIRLQTILPDLAQERLTEQQLLSKIQEPNFVPEGTTLNKELFNSQFVEKRFSFVVDEYGDVQGLITAEDVIREIVGEIGTDPSSVGPEVDQQSDGRYVVDASANIRQLNRLMNWNLPTDGPKTLNGLIIELLETIPEPGADLTVANYPIEILETAEHGIKKVCVLPPGDDEPPAMRTTSSS
jgi:Mg2+/Co2+ transporter CorB